VDVPIMRDIRRKPHSRLSSNPNRATAFFSFSANSTLVWRPGEAFRSQLTWFDRNGRAVGTIGPAGNYTHVRLSFDGKRAVVHSPGQGSLLLNANERSGLTVPHAFTPLWSVGDALISIPDSGATSAYERSAGENGNGRELVRVQPMNWLQDVSADGSLLLFTRQSGPFAIPLVGDVLNRMERHVLQNVSVDNAHFSPDARWVVYASAGIFVQSLGATGFRKEISLQGLFPLWRRDGKEIFFMKQQPAKKLEMCAVPVNLSGSGIQLGEQACLFEVKPSADWLSGTVPYDVTRDGSRILIPLPSEQPRWST
jgi:hypothetical protein